MLVIPDGALGAAPGLVDVGQLPVSKFVAWVEDNAEVVADPPVEGIHPARECSDIVYLVPISIFPCALVSRCQIQVVKE